MITGRRRIHKISLIRRTNNNTTAKCHDKNSNIHDISATLSESTSPFHLYFALLFIYFFSEDLPVTLVEYLVHSKQ